MTTAKFVSILCFAVTTLLLTTGSECTEAAAEGKQEAREFRQDITRSYSINYLLYLPSGYSSSQEQWPLLLFLHGAGERGDDLEWLLQQRRGSITPPPSEGLAEEKSARQDQR